MLSVPPQVPHGRRAAAAAAALAVLAAVCGVVAPGAAAAAAHAPAPTGLRTSPATSCAGNTVIGVGDVTLSAVVSSPTGGTVDTDFKLSLHGSEAVVAEARGLAAPSGTEARYFVSRDVLGAAAHGAITEFDWKVRTWDAGHPGTWSTTCHFSYDATVPAAPVVTLPTGNPVVGTPTTVTVSAGAGGSVPAGYQYLLNAGTGGTVTADAAGNAVITLTPSRQVNTLAVYALSPGGNMAGPTEVYLYAALPPAPPEPPAPPLAAENDLNGDGLPDLLLPGNQASLAAGLWLVPGTAAHGLGTAANVGTAGIRAGSTGGAADWNGKQVIVGHYSSGLGKGYNDVLVYDPATGTGRVLPGAGDGSGVDLTKAVDVQQGAFHAELGSSVADHVANGGRLFEYINEEPAPGYPGLLMTLDGSLLVEQANTLGGPGAFMGTPGALPISDVNPTGNGNWKGWTITTALVDDLPGLFARSDVGGQLYYYTPDMLKDLAYGNPATPVQIASEGWDAAAKPVLQAADIDRDGTVDLWAVDAQGVATAYRFDGTSLTALSTGSISG